MRTQFPILEDRIYLNTPYTGLLSKEVKSAIELEHERYFSAGDAYKKEYMPTLQLETEKALCDFLSGGDACVYLTQSFSSGFSKFLFAVPKEYKFLLLEEDYPSLSTLVEDHGFSFDQMKITEDIEEQLLQKIANGNYQALALSVIQYTSGLYFDLEVLKKIKLHFPNLLILLDGTQFLAAELYLFSNCVADAIFASTYKWFLAGYGTGFACIRPSVFSQLGVDEKVFEERYDRGHISLPSIAALNTALDQIKKSNFNDLMNHKNRVNAYLYNQLERIGKLPSLAAKRKQHAAFYNLKLNDESYQKLLINKVDCIQRGGGVRVGVHHYNSMTDVDDFIEVLLRLD